MNIAVYSYCTDGYFDFCKIFVESYCMFNDMPLILDLRGFTDKQFGEINGIVLKYKLKKWDIIKKPIRYDDWAKQAGISVEQLKAYKDQIEKINFGVPDKMDPKARVWKLFTSGEARIKRMYEHMTSRKLDGIIMIDIDTLFRGNVGILKTLCGQYDFVAKIRLGAGAKMAISNGLACYQNTKIVCEWIKDWISVIDKTPPMQRPLGFGQISAWMAFEKHMHDMKFLDLIQNYPRFGIPWNNAATDLIWTCNIFGLPKTFYPPKFNQEIKRMKKAGGTKC